MEDNMNMTQTPDTGNQAGTYYGQQPQSGAYYGQMPNAYGQQPNPYAAALQPQPPQKKKKSRAGLIIAFVALGILLIGAVACVLLLLLGDSPQAKIGKGIRNWAKESEVYGSSIEDQLGWEQIQKMMSEESASVNISMDLTVPDMDVPTIGVDARSDIDRTKKQQNTEITLSISNMQLLQLLISADADRVYLTCPELAENTYSFETEQLGRKFNASAWAEMTGLTLDEDLGFELWAKSDETEEAQTAEELFGEEALKRMTEDMEQILQTMTAEATDTSIEIERGGKKESCDGYRVILNKEALNGFLDDLQEEIRSGQYGQMVKDRMMENLDVPTDIDEIWEEVVSILDARFTDDLELIFYLDKKDRIVHMATPEPIRLDTSDIGFAFAVDFNGSERTLDDVSGMIKLIGETPEESLGIAFTRTAECGKDIYDNRFEITLTGYDAYGGEEESISAVYSNRWDLKTYDFDIDFMIYVEDEKLSVNLEGDFENIRKGEAFTLNVGSASLRMNDEMLLKIRGTYEVGPLEGKVEIPGSATNLLTMSENEIMTLVYEMVMNVQEMLGLGTGLLW
ncbi:MAG: hypothetical protein HDR26_09410 [Lachnospiraceae bacterium]|nr:hypothetical protein [Lachnospiraceae bacterium]